MEAAGEVEMKDMDDMKKHKDAIKEYTANDAEMKMELDGVE